MCMEIQQLSKIFIRTYNMAVNILWARRSWIFVNVLCPYLQYTSINSPIFRSDIPYIFLTRLLPEKHCNVWFQLWLLSVYQKWTHGSHWKRLLPSRSTQWPSLFRPVSCSCCPAINYLWDQQKADCHMRAHLHSKKWTRYTWPQIWHYDHFISILEWEELEQNKIIGYKL